MTRTEYDLPPLSKPLINALDAMYPERSPEETEDHDRLMWRGGQRSVVRKLMDEYRRQSNNILTRP